MVITSVTVTTVVFAFVVAVIILIIDVKFIPAYQFYQLSGGSLLVSPQLNTISKRFTPAH
jgi:hypothetical protein